LSFIILVLLLLVLLSLLRADSLRGQYRAFHQFLPEGYKAL
jgi:hypothetical protein